jgi:hypothetical protein
MAKRIISLRLLSGTSSNTTTLQIDNGTTVGIVGYSSAANNDHNNPSMVRAKITVNGQPIVDLQPFDNLRSRNVPYLQDGIPVSNLGGKTIEFQIISQSNFTADTDFDLVINYANSN